MVGHHGEFFDFAPLQMLPAPEAPVPILCGGLHARFLERAARLCDGWISPGSSPDDFARIFETIEAKRDRATG